ncbi:hypothetical protein H8B09_21900 [Paenibacillus sp. PR3]|uniref:Uncharacterized protein n=1 Tax=Paenibacillus terricola TaxID=2763503 RepID=A0ABR8N4Q2_9BACL|nr:hypothetical protein [Paenibacillus terricola]MBD3921439.1 hypothetical protein [Paenibacillus terricola]
MLELIEPLPLLIDKDPAERTTFKISHMEVFRMDCKLAENNPIRNIDSYNCGLLKIAGQGAAGFAEYVIPDTKLNHDLVRWASVFKKLKGLSIAEALRYVQDKEEAWGPTRQEAAIAALTDLSMSLIDPLHQPETSVRSLEWSALIERSQSYYSF